MNKTVFKTHSVLEGWSSTKVGAWTGPGPRRGPWRRTWRRTRGRSWRRAWRRPWWGARWRARGRSRGTRGRRAAWGTGARWRSRGGAGGRPGGRARARGGAGWGTGGIYVLKEISILHTDHMIALLRCPLNAGDSVRELKAVHVRLLDEHCWLRLRLIEDRWAVHQG